MKQAENMRLLDRFCLLLTRHRKKVFFAILIITGCFLYNAFHIRGEVILSEMLPYDHPYLKLHASFSKVFGSGGSGVVIALKAKKEDIFNETILSKVKKITREVELWDEVYRVLTVSIASHSTKVVTAKGKGVISVTPLMFPDVPATEKEMEVLKKNIFSNPAYNGTLVSRDGIGTLILTEFKENISYQRAFDLLAELKDTYTDENTSVHIVGYPVLMGWIYSLKPQMYMVFGISIFAIGLVLVMVFRNIAGMIAPLINSGILTIWGLGFIGLTGLNFNPLLYVLAFLVGSRMIGNSTQITHRYFEELSNFNGNRFQACYETMRTMWFPNAAAVASDVGGFLVLFLAKIALMQHLAIIMSFWMATIVLTGFLVPTVCSLIPFKVKGGEWSKETCQADWKARAIMKITNFSIAPGSRVVVAGAVVVVMVFCFYQMTKLKIGDATPGSPIFYSDHPYNRDQAVIDQAFDMSSENFMLFYEGKPDSVNDPVVLNTFESFARYMKARLPDIYKSSASIIDIAKMTNLTYHDGDKIWYQFPRNETMVTGIMNMVKQKTPRGTFERFLDTTGERAQVTVFFSDHTSENLLRIRDAAYDFFKGKSMRTENGEFKLAGGRIGMEIAVNEEMKRAHLIIDLTVYLGIFILCALSYRSFVAGLMLTFPLILANSIAAAYMSMRDIGLSINSLPVAAIGAGVGVDFAIYLYSRCIEEFKLHNGEWRGTILQSVCTSGKAIVYTGITVILPILTWYFFSDMKFQAEAGFFLSLIMAANVVLSLTLHPLMIWIIKPKFIGRKYPYPEIQTREVRPEPNEEFI